MGPHLCRVYAAEATAVSSDQDSSTLINNGNIFSGFSSGVQFEGANGTIINNAGRNIFGPTLGIAVLGESTTVTNLGTIAGDLFGMFYVVDGRNFVLNNDGEIYGEIVGIDADVFSSTGIVNNSGLIHSDQTGISVRNLTQITNINNDDGGTIKGLDAAIFTINGGRISLTNSGTIDGKIECTATNGNVDDIMDSVRGSKRDKILDFARGEDHIDLKGIDAKTGVSGIQKFTWIGKPDFHGKKGELRYEDKGNKVIVQGDVNGDGKAEFEIRVGSTRWPKATSCSSWHRRLSLYPSRAASRRGVRPANVDGAGLA